MRAAESTEQTEQPEATGTAAAPQRSFLFVSGSTRDRGNAELLARHAATRLGSDVEQRWVALRDLDLPPYTDVRHAADAAGTGADAATDDQHPVLQGLLDATLHATDIVIVSPLYWYTLTTNAKLYLDHWTSWLRRPGVGFRERMRGKRLWAVTIVSTADPRTAEPLQETLRLTAEYLDMTWSGGLVGHGNRPGDVMADQAARRAAERFFDDARAEGRSVTRT